MKRNLFTIFLALALVVALAFVIAPSAKAETTMTVVKAEGTSLPADFDFDTNILDLNGNDVTVAIPENKTLYAINTSFMPAEENGKPNFSGTHAGSLTNTGSGKIAHISYDGSFRYLAVEDNGTYTFHPFNMAFTHMGINTLAGENDDKVAVCLRVAFIANDIALKALTEHGIYNVDTEQTASAVKNYPFSEDANICYAYFDFVESLNAEEIDNQRNIKAYVTIDGETVYTDFTLEFIPREILKGINARILLNEGEDGKIVPTVTQEAAIKTLMGTNTRVNNIFSCYREEGSDCTHESKKDLICLDCGESFEDTTAYELENGGFENGLEGWTLVGNIGGISADTHYWPWEDGGYAFGMDGEKMFSAYAPGAEESAVGTLTSSTFTVGGSGFVTFKVGAMRDGNYVYVDVVDANTKQILARYYNGLWQDTTEGVKSGCTMVAYKADLSEFRGKEVFFRISDNADSGYGLFFVDSFVTYYRNEPEGFNYATPVNYAVSGTIYDLFNGGFEMGDVQGWWNNGEPGKVTGADAFFSGVAYGKDGAFLYSGVEDHNAGNGREGNKGVLTSSVFEIGGNGYITYMLGGGNGHCYVQVIDSTTGEILARYRQQAREDAVLKKYVADLRAYIGRTVRIQVVDNATYDWGCVSFDNVVTYYNSVPDGMLAIDVKYEIVNGSFESGKTDWKQNGDNLGEVIRDEINEGWYTKNDDNKDGDHLFSFAFFNAEGGVVNVEGGKGNIESTNFVLKQGSFVSFRFGGAGGGSNHDVYIELCRADGSVIARFYNDAPGKVNTRMNAYYYQYQGEEADCFFRVVDNSQSDYGCFVVDDFRVNLENAPTDFIEAMQ